MVYEKGITKFIMPEDKTFKDDTGTLYEVKKGDTLTYTGTASDRGNISYTFEELEGAFDAQFFIGDYYRNPKIDWEASYGELIDKYLNYVSGTYSFGEEARNKIKEMMYVRLKSGKCFWEVKEDFTELFDAICLEP